MLNRLGAWVLLHGEKRVVRRTRFCLLAIGCGLIAMISPAGAETFQWLQLGPAGLEARVITEEPNCPTTHMDGAGAGMSVRASPRDGIRNHRDLAVRPRRELVAIVVGSLDVPVGASWVACFAALFMAVLGYLAALRD